MKTTTVQKLALGQQDREVWYRGKKVSRVELTEYPSYPYRLTFSDGSQDFAEAADIVTCRLIPNHDTAIPADPKTRGKSKLFKD